MKFLIPLVLICSLTSFAHKNHRDDELKAGEPLTGRSILQLGSTWKNQKGKSVNLTNLRNKPQLVIMLFTSCDTACPLIVEDVKEIALEVDSKQTEKIQVSVFSLDSFRETPETLLNFSIKRKLPSNWGLYTSDASAVAELAAALGVRYKRLPNGDFIHSNVIYYLNKEGEVTARKEGINTPRTDFIKQIRQNL